MKNNMNHLSSQYSKDIKLIIKEAQEGKTDHLEHMLKDIKVSRAHIYDFCDIAAVNLAANGHTNAIKDMQELGIKMKKILPECYKEALKNGYKNTANYLGECIKEHSILNQRKSYDINHETVRNSNLSQQKDSMGKLMDKFKNSPKKTMSDIDRLRAAEDVYHNRLEVVQRDKDGKVTGNIPFDDYMKNKKTAEHQPVHKTETKRPERQASSKNERTQQRATITFGADNVFDGGNVILGPETINGKVIQNGVEIDVRDLVEKRADGATVLRADEMNGITFFGSASRNQGKDFMEDHIKEQCKAFDERQNHSRHGSRNEVHFGRMEASSINGVLANHGVINGKVTMTDGKVDIDLGEDR